MRKIDSSTFDIVRHPHTRGIIYYTGPIQHEIHPLRPLPRRRRHHRANPYQPGRWPSLVPVRHRMKTPAKAPVFRARRFRGYFALNTQVHRRLRIYPHGCLRLPLGHRGVSGSLAFPRQESQDLRGEYRSATSLFIDPAHQQAAVKLICLTTCRMRRRLGYSESISCPAMAASRAPHAAQ